MKKTKIEIKYIVYSSLILSIVLLPIFALSCLCTNLTNSIIVKIITLLVFAVISSFLIILGLSRLNSAIPNIILSLKRKMRWENLSNSLLLKLSVEAPGTYHHSLIVSTLAQRLARSIGADPLLVRTAAYYHDIGKLVNPKAYIENQSLSEIPKKESASMIRDNAKEIISHVERGVKIAQDNKLPQEIINLIREHHGTTKALFYYDLAKDRGLKIKKTDFKYRGPVPQTKESLVLMLADCVEATARAYPELNQEQIAEIVNSTVEDKVKDNQFSKLKIRPAELEKAKDSLVDTLGMIYHQRINYNPNDKNR